MDRSLKESSFIGFANRDYDLTILTLIIKLLISPNFLFIQCSCEANSLTELELIWKCCNPRLQGSIEQKLWYELLNECIEIGGCSRFFVVQLKQHFHNFSLCFVEVKKQVRSVGSWIASMESAWRLLGDYFSQPVLWT